MKYTHEEAAQFAAYARSAAVGAEIELRDSEVPGESEVCIDSPCGRSLIAIWGSKGARLFKMVPPRCVHVAKFFPADWQQAIQFVNG